MPIDYPAILDLKTEAAPIRGAIAKSCFMRSASAWAPIL